MLVDRAHGGLTDDGARVVERARRVLRELDDIAADMASATRRRRRRAPRRDRHDRPLADAPAARRCRARHPHVRVIVAEGSTSALIPALLSGQLDAAIVHLPVDDPELTIEPLFAEDLLLLVGDRHPLAARRRSARRARRASPAAAAAGLGAAPGARPRRRSPSVPSSQAQAEIDGVRLLASLAFDGYGAAIVPATAVPQRLKGASPAVARARTAAACGRLAPHRRRHRARAAKALLDVAPRRRCRHGRRAARRPPRRRRLPAPPLGAADRRLRSVGDDRHGACRCAATVDRRARPSRCARSTVAGRRPRRRLDRFVERAGAGKGTPLSSTPSSKIEHAATAPASKGCRSSSCWRRPAPTSSRASPALDGWGRRRQGARRLLGRGARRSSSSTAPRCPARRCCSASPTSSS